MSVSANHKYLFDFIKKTFTEDSFDRMFEIKQNDGDDDECHKSYQEFVDHNFECVNKLSLSDVSLYVNLCKKISKDNILLVDEESFIEFDAGTVYFNIHGKFVIMNYR